MDDLLKVTAVSFLNTKPLLFGIVMNNLDKAIQLSLEDPASCAQKLKDNKTDIALIPVAAIPEIPGAKIISDFCIGSTDKVKSVCIFSQVPIEEIETILMDYESRTSVMLAYILLREYWKLNPSLQRAQPGFESLISGKTAAVVIGDKAMDLEGKFDYVYDLGEIWKLHTGLPFVFAAWVTTKEIDASFLQKFNHALASGIDHIPSLLYILPNPNPQIDLHAYFTKNISYRLDSDKRAGLNLFFEKIKLYSAEFKKTLQVKYKQKGQVQ